MISIKEARERVARGAAYLDHVRPGWFHLIDVGTLTLHEACGCIIGQLCGDYFKHKEIGLTREKAQACGFEYMPPKKWYRDNGVSHQTPSQRRVHHQPLQDAWIEAIADRRLLAAPNRTQAFDAVPASTDNK